MPGAYPDSSASNTRHVGGTTSQTTSGIPDRTRDNTTTSGDREHHHGRDAAIAGGAAGLAGAA